MAKRKPDGAAIFHTPPAPLTIHLTIRLPYPLAEGIIAMAEEQRTSPGAVIAEALDAYFIRRELYAPLSDLGRHVPINVAHDRQLPPNDGSTPNGIANDDADQRQVNHEQKEQQRKKRKRARKHWTQRPEYKKTVAAMALKGARTRKRNAKLAAANA